MKKRLFAIIASCLLILCLVIPVAAETYESENNMSVTFTAEGKMVDDFANHKLDDELSEFLQPGDTAIFRIQLKNEYAGETDWWMENKVLYSLEDRSKDSETKGGGYSYRLVYKPTKGDEKILFDSMNVGGDDTSAGEGLHEIVNVLRDDQKDDRDDRAYFYLDSFNKGEGGSITLTVSLDGETQGNDYQDTMADLAMNFAVEKPVEVETTTSQKQTTTTPQQRTTTPHSVKTGDETNITIYFVILAAAGVAILVIALVMAKRRRKENQS